MSDAEYVVLVDDQGRDIGTAPKHAVHTASTPLHRGFSLFLFDPAGRVLLQRRALGKATWPGVWSNSCCGHPMAGESVIEAARRRTAFELGVEGIEPWIVSADFRYRAELAGVVEHEICPILAAPLPSRAGELRPNPDEVAEVRWMAWPRFVESTRERPESWSPWSVLEVERLEADPGFRTWSATLAGSQ
jgi:isopentenyl-diphosphate delta-isomerase type 1